MASLYNHWPTVIFNMQMCCGFYSVFAGVIVRMVLYGDAVEEGLQYSHISEFAALVKKLEPIIRVLLQIIIRR